MTVTPTSDTGVAIVFKSDDDSNELDETLTLTLVPKPFTLQTFPRGEAVFFMNSINLTILDHKGIVHNCLQSMVPLSINTEIVTFKCGELSNGNVFDNGLYTELVTLFSVAP